MEKEIITIIEYLSKQGFTIEEGSASLEQLRYLAKLACRQNVKIIGEVGFNAGFSSYVFLKANPKAKVISFDIAEHKYIKTAKRFVDQQFPKRHALIKGDSKQTIPQFSKKHPDVRFDLVFIDGGHDYKTAESDIVNMKLLSTPQTLLVMDDLTPWLPWGRGPTHAWIKAIQKGIIIQKELIKDGRRINTIKPPGQRSWALGQYII